MRGDDTITMNTLGIVIGIISFLSIGIFHPIVIKAEYFFTYRCWPVFLLAGIGFLVCSLLVEGIVLSCALAVVGFSCLWSILELLEQKKRVEKGWFPANPKRKQKKEQQ